MKSIINAEILGGFQDFLPEKMLKFKSLVSKIEKVYESFGFTPMDTPCMERVDVLIGDSSDFNKSIFISRVVRGLEDKGVDDVLMNEQYGLRFDLTVPLARFVVSHPDLGRPFKRYQIGKVWRGEKPQSGRFREFYQFDFDIVGSKNILSDIETLNVVYKTLKTLSLDNFKIKINDRRILNGLAEIIGCGNSANEFFRIIDKIDSMGIEHVITDLEDNFYFGKERIKLSDDQVQLVKRFLVLKKESLIDTLDNVEKMFDGKTKIGLEGIDSLRKIFIELDRIGVDRKFYDLDLSIVRGLDYYTGMVFETTIEGFSNLGSIFSGGRYDNLVERFSLNYSAPAVGASIGLDRLLVILEKQNRLNDINSRTEVFVTVFNDSLRGVSLETSVFLRESGINTELFIGDNSFLKEQLVYALKKGIRYVIVIGPDENNSGTLQIKDTKERKQLNMKLRDVVEFIKNNK